jgi:hypothetical protein
VPPLVVVLPFVELKLLLALPVGAQHCSLAGPGQYPEVEKWPAIVAQTEVSMQTPLTPPTVHEGGGVATLARGARAPRGTDR